jgi:FkbM family methyltransferase
LTVPPSPFHSQVGEDAFLVEHHYVPARGIFVDVGAGDPKRFSNTYYFEQMGWYGICVDADPKQVEALRLGRRCIVEHAAVTSAGEEIELLQSDAPDYSTTLDPANDTEMTWTRVRVPATRLETLLERHEIERIDLLSIDTEGTELDVCDSLDWSRHTPSIVIIEYLTIGRASNEEAIRHYFAALQYHVIHATMFNLLFAFKRQPLRRRLRHLLS